VLEPLTLTRIVTTVEALAAAVFADGAIVFRTAPDEALVLDAGQVHIDDPHAIIVQDTGWCGAWLDAGVAIAFLRAEAAWAPPPRRPAQAQGRVGNAPVKLWFEEDRVLFVVPHVVAQDFAERMVK